MLQVQMGCYQEGIAKDSVGGEDVTAHIFESVVTSPFPQWSLLTVFSRYTSNVVVSDSGEVSTGACPVQIVFCLKEQNKKKLNSHRWAINGACPLLRPNGQLFPCIAIMYSHHTSVCVLLDVGTKPTGTSIYELWKCK
jgi:chitin synthase